MPRPPRRRLAHPPADFLGRGGPSRDPVPVADFSPRVEIAWRFALAAARRYQRCRPRLRGVHGMRRSGGYCDAPTASAAEIAAWAGRHGMVLVDRADFETKCGMLASMMAETAEHNADFDRFLLGL